MQAIKNDPAVTAINDNNLWSRIPFIFWFRSVGATMFSHEGVLKLVGCMVSIFPKITSDFENLCEIKNMEG